MVFNRFRCPPRNPSFANSQRSGSTFRKPYIEEFQDQLDQIIKISRYFSRTKKKERGIPKSNTNRIEKLNLFLVRTYISIKLTNEAGEIRVFEVSRKQGTGEFMIVPNDEAIASFTPRNNGVRQRIFHHFKCLRQKRRRTDIVQPFDRLGSDARRR